MKIVKDLEKDDIITVNEFINKIKRREGVLITITKDKRFLVYKGSTYCFYQNKKFDYGWVSLYFNRGHDNNRIADSLNDFINVITNAVFNEFHWFENEEDAYLWIANKIKEWRKETKDESKN